MILGESLPRILFLESQDVCPRLTVSLSVPRPQVALIIRVMHLKGVKLEELKGKHPRGQWGEGIIPIFLSKPVSPSLLGEYEKPSLSARPSTVVPLGQTVTLWCHSGPPFVIFRLFKRVGTSLHKIQEQHFNTFTLGPVTTEHAGSYTCSGADWSRFVWSDVSDPLPIMVTGRRVQPSPGHLCLQAILPQVHVPCSQRHPQDSQPELNQGKRTKSESLNSGC